MTSPTAAPPVEVPGAAARRRPGRAPSVHVETTDRGVAGPFTPAHDPTPLRGSESLDHQSDKPV